MKKRTVWTCQGFVLFFALALVAVVMGLPWLGGWFADFRGLQKVVERCIILCVYICAVPAGVALHALWVLLRNIARERIFEQGNCRLLHRISLCCFLVAVIAVAATYHYLPFVIVAVAMLFLTVVLRVIYYCMHVGTELREENNLTI